MNQDDDASYKLLFAAPEVVRDLVLGFIPDAWLHGLDYSTLEKVPASYVADDLRKRSDDVVWRVPRNSSTPLPSGSGPCCSGAAGTPWSYPKYATWWSWKYPRGKI